MKEDKIDRHPFSMVIIPVFYGFMAAMSMMGFSGKYIFFGFVLPRSISMVLVAIETMVLIFLTIGIFKKQKFARSLLIYYNAYAITDIFFTLLFINKEELMTLLKVDNAALEEYANINLFFCLILFIILRHIKKHKEFFVN